MYTKPVINVRYRANSSDFISIRRLQRAFEWQVQPVHRKCDMCVRVISSNPAAVSDKVDKLG